MASETDNRLNIHIIVGKLCLFSDILALLPALRTPFQSENDSVRNRLRNLQILTCKIR